MSKGAELIAVERDEQINKHGFKETDDDYLNGELIESALFCIDPKFEFDDRWPDDWSEHFKDKIRAKTRIQQLTVAGAFIAAEIDRLQRLEEPPEAPDPEPLPAEVELELPTDLAGCVNYFLSAFNEMVPYMEMTEDEFASFCQSQLSGGIQMQMRNRLGLWEEQSPLRTYFQTEHHLDHPDSMSDLIVRHIYRQFKPQS